MSDAERVAVARLMHRLGFGPSGTDYPEAVALGSAAYVARLLLDVNPTNAMRDDTITPPPLMPYNNRAAAESKAAYEQARRDQERVLKLWWLERMATSRQPLLERVTWFWHGHWATSEIKVRDCRFMLAQNQTLRSNALGAFPAMCKAMLRDPAMLIWLDGQGNRKGRPNENLGRELLELFTLGVGNYTETDVREASRALTGWSIDFVAGIATRNDARFDSAPKTVLGETAPFDVDWLVDHVVAQPQCAAFISARLWKRFVSDEPAPPEVARTLADGFHANHSISTVVAAVAQLLADPNATYPLAKSPVDWLVATLRVLNLRPSELSMSVQSGMLSDITAMGQLPFFPPNVSGWPSGRAWFSATTAQSRMQCTQRLVATAPNWLRKATPRERPALLADRLGVPAWSAPTQQALANASNSARDAIVLALNSPDYLVGV